MVEFPANLSREQAEQWVDGAMTWADPVELAFWLREAATLIGEPFFPAMLRETLHNGGFRGEVLEAMAREFERRIAASVVLH